ncbi:CDT1-like protein b isoform X2 [Ziziphus jujuba]|uniref:CDT1-like protein b isoform X2 n=1 Tax=Ziziphus jujuba TaxID=326968 RepID=A0ABM4A0U4_ZIZJJ|nr:CDT1-like protein b isoform X2 [Ziziphus jujuba]
MKLHFTRNFEMDKKIVEDGVQNVSDFNSKKILIGGEKSTALSPAPVKKLGIIENKILESNKIACQTPEKINETLHHKVQEGEIKIPDKYRIIAELFDYMNFSLRLLGLFKRIATFQNISTQVEVLSKRNFSYKHLAQMKYIFPEAFQIEKILLHDKKTLCMKPYMKITLLFDVVEGHCEVSDFVALRRVFSLRLYKFFMMNPEASDVPEAILPELFTQRCQIPVPAKLPVDSLLESQPTSIRTEIFAEKVLPYFSKNFSQSAAVSETGICSVSNSISDEDKWTGQLKETPGTGSESTHRNPEVENHNQCSVGPSTYGSPLVKLTSSDDSFRTETPAQSIPSRLVPSCDNKQKLISSRKPTSCLKPAKRVLDFSHSEGDKSALSYSDDESKCYKSVHQDIPRTYEGFFGDENAIGSSSSLQEMAESFCCPNEDCNQTHELNSQDSSGCMGDMVGLIHSIFKSVKYTPITKEELVHKIIMNNFDIVDKREVQEHIDHLEKLVPDWIRRKMAPSGDVMYNIEEVSDLDSVRAKAH